MRSLVEQLRDAYEKSGLTMDELLDRSGLDLDRSSLRRKLLVDSDSKNDRSIPMKTEECEALARALDVTLVVVPEDEARAS
jgi:hypothetical protein